MLEFQEPAQVLFNEIRKQWDDNLSKMFGPDGALEPFKERFVVDVFPPEFTVQDDAVQQGILKLGFRQNFYIRYKTEDELNQ